MLLCPEVEARRVKSDVTAPPTCVVLPRLVYWPTGQASHLSVHANLLFLTTVRTVATYPLPDMPRQITRNSGKWTQQR